MADVILHTPSDICVKEMEVLVGNVASEVDTYWHAGYSVLRPDRGSPSKRGGVSAEQTKRQENNVSAVSTA